jgi:pyrroloquinoline quinone biosynthesis protein B
LDQCLGLLLLREFQPLNVYATESVIHILREQNSMFAMLNRGSQPTCWRAIHAGQDFELRTPDGSQTGITCTPISVSSRYASYVPNPANFRAEDAALGLRVSSSGKTLAYFPSCGELTDSVREAICDVDLLLFDGTFYTDDELVKVLQFGPRAREIDHLPVGGQNGSLRQLAATSAKRKMYIHINNTNPMLNESSAEYRAVRNAGWELAEDGWQAVL